MKKINYSSINLLFFACVLFVLYSCEDEYEAPGPEFSYPLALRSPTSLTVEVGNIASMSDISRGVVSRTWTAPEGAEIANDNNAQTSSAETVHIRFNQTGIFDVTLSSQFLNPEVSLDTVFSVTVLDSIEAAIGYTTDPVQHTNNTYELPSGKITISAGSSVFYKDISTGAPDTHNWLFEGGDPGSTNRGAADSAVAVLYKRLGTFDVQLISSRNSPSGRPDTMLLEDFVEVIPSTEPVDVVRITEDDRGRVQVFFSRGIDETTLGGTIGNFTLMVDGEEAEINSVFINSSDESILMIEPIQNIKNSQTATLTYTDGGVFSTDLYEVDNFGPIGIDIYAPNLIEVAGISHDFEAGLTGWTPRDGVGITTDAHTGNGAMIIRLNEGGVRSADFRTITDFANHPLNIDIDESVVNDEDRRTVYVLRFWYKVIGDPPPVEFRVKLLGEENWWSTPRSAWHGGFNSSHTEWTLREIVYESNILEDIPNGRLMIRAIGNSDGNVRGDIIIDDMALFVLER
ncbi:MAG: hypothetical protein MJA30_33035 [Cytophagales bacterium]|nr:hypothetical protein [Cytophagales bacterium]